LLVVFLLSCTAQPPVVKQATSPLPSASPFWLPPPQASHPVIGKALRPAPKPIQASNQGFQIKGSSSTESRQCLYLDPTNTSGSILASITGTINADVTMIEGTLYPNSSPDSNFTMSVKIRQPTTAIYSTGMDIPKLVFPDKILEPNQNYSFPLPSGTVLSFNDSHHFLGGATGSIAFNTTSSGASLTISGSILKGSNYPGDPFTYAKAELSKTLYFSGSMSTCVPAITLASNIDTVDLGSTDTNLNQAQFTITPENKTKAWTLNITGPNNFSQNYQGTGNNNTFTLGGNIPTGPYTAALFYDDLPSYKAVLNLTVVRNDSLDLTLSQSLLVPNGAPSSADAQVTVSNPSRPWELLLQRTGPANGCNADQQSFGPFTGNQTIPISSTGLPDGEYALTARYTDDPNSAKIANFNISSLLKLTPSATELPYGGSVSFSVQAPLCPGWKLFVDSEECTLSTGAGNAEGITWDGTCNGNRVGPFPHSVQLVAGDKTDSATIQVSNLTFPTPTPPPTATPTPDPNASGSPDPNATPTPGPTTTPCPGTCPTPTPVPTATPCPGGICPTPTPPVQTPTPRPTATPTKKPGNESKELDLTLVVEPEISNPEEAFSILQTKVSTGHFKIGYGTYVDLGGEVYLKKENKAKAAVAEALATIRATGTVRLVDSSGNQIPGFRIPFEFLSTRGTAKLESTKWFGRNGAGAGPNFVPAGKYSLIGIIDNVDIRYNEPNPTTLITLKVLNINKEVMVINDFPLYSSKNSTPKVFTPDSIQHILERHKRDYLSKAQHAFFVNTLTEMKDIIVREGMATNPNAREKTIPTMVRLKVDTADNRLYGLADKVNPYRKDDSFPDQFSANYVLEMARSVANMSDVADQWGIGKDLTHKETGAPIESIALMGKRGATTLSAFAYYGQPQNEDQIIRTAFPTNLPLGSPYSRKGMKNLHYYTKICDPLFDPNDPIALFTRYSSFSRAEHTAWETSCFTNLQQFVPAGMR